MIAHDRSIFEASYEFHGCMKAYRDSADTCQSVVGRNCEEGSYRFGVKECMYIILSQNGGSLSEFYKVMLHVKEDLHLFSSITSDSYSI